MATMVPQPIPIQISVAAIGLIRSNQLSRVHLTPSVLTHLLRGGILNGVLNISILLQVLDEGIRDNTYYTGQLWHHCSLLLTSALLCLSSEGQGAVKSQHSHGCLV